VDCNDKILASSCAPIGDRLCPSDFLLCLKYIAVWEKSLENVRNALQQQRSGCGSGFGRCSFSVLEIVDEAEIFLYTTCIILLACSSSFSFLSQRI
jgi:hypothetical protein